MNEQTTKLIEQLAEKLGTTSQYLWSVLLKQAPIDATVTLMQILAVILFGVILYRTHKKLSVDKENGYNTYDDSDAAGPVMVILALVFVVLFLLCFCCIGGVVNGYYNPEYWALDRILNHCK